MRLIRIKTPRPYRIYRHILRLYPKSFRTRYGQEMVQVLDDLLAEETNTLGRLKVWLRISSELPRSIIQENIGSVREKSARSAALRKDLRLFITIVTALAAVVLVASVDTLRSHVLPNVAGVFFHHGIVRNFDAQNDAIGDPMMDLAKNPPSTKYSCDVEAAQGVRTEVGCRASAEAYIKLNEAGSKASVMSTVTTVESSLKQAGYKPGGNGVTLTSLMGGTYEGKDYSPDAFYQKIVGTYDCIFETRIAYRNPAPPAISMKMQCLRTINILGVPSTATYQSTQGFGD